MSKPSAQQQQQPTTIYSLLRERERGTAPETTDTTLLSRLFERLKLPTETFQDPYSPSPMPTLVLGDTEGGNHEE